MGLDKDLSEGVTQHSPHQYSVLVSTWLPRCLQGGGVGVLDNVSGAQLLLGIQKNEDYKQTGSLDVATQVKKATGLVCHRMQKEAV